MAARLRLPRRLFYAPAAENGGKALAEEIKANVSKIAESIKLAHSRINNTVMEIGKSFFSVKQILDAVPTDVRRAHRIPSFTVWMNKLAPTVCEMSDRTAWHYYKQYSEAIASGLKEETIVALAPNVLKNEKPRKAVLSILTKNPALATQLNEAANKPVALRKLADSEEFKDVLKRAEAPATKSRAERVEAAIINAYKPVFITDRENITVEDANTAIAELSAILHRCVKRLGISSHLSVSISPWTAATIRAEKPAEVEEPVVTEKQTEVELLLKKLADMGYKVPTHLAATA